MWAAILSTGSFMMHKHIDKLVVAMLALSSLLSCLSAEQGTNSPRLPPSGETQPSDNTQTMQFTTRDRLLELKLDALPVSPQFIWLNPRTGKKTPAVAIVLGETAQFPTPQEGEWILVVKGGKRAYDTSTSSDQKKNGAQS